MPKKLNDVDEYLETLSDSQREWVGFFVEYMRENHADLEEVISFKMPTYKLGSGKLRNYIAFSPAKNHFSMHTMDFEYVEFLKEKLSTPGNGKGCVKVKYKNLNEKAILLEAIEEILKRKKLSVYGKQN